MSLRQKKFCLIEKTDSIFFFRIDFWRLNAMICTIPSTVAVLLCLLLVGPNTFSWNSACLLRVLHVRSEQGTSFTLRRNSKRQQIKSRIGAFPPLKGTLVSNQNASFGPPKESLKARESPATLIDEAATSQENWKTVAGGIGCGLWFIVLSSAFVSKATNASRTASGFQHDWKAIAAGIVRGLGFAVSCVMLLGWVFVAHEKVVALDTESGGQDDWKTVTAGIGRGLGFVLSCLMLQTSVFIADEGTDAAHTMAGWMALQSMALMVAFFVGHVPSILTGVTVFATYIFLCSVVPDDRGATFVAWFPTCVAIIINTFVIGYAIRDAMFSTQRDTSNQPVV
jgi:hypothetical protein